MAINWDNFPVIPGYDPVQCKREAHAQTRYETEGMNKEEIREYYRKNSEELQREREAYRVKHGIK